MFAAIGDDLRIYWCSHPQSEHSKNIARTGKVFIIVFDATGDGGGLFMQARAAQLEDTDVPAGLDVFNAARKRLLREAITLAEVTGDSPQRLYCAVPEKLWINVAERNQAGHIVRDHRIAVDMPMLATS